MLSQVAIELLIIFGLILANGFFSGAELALVSVRRTRLEPAAEEGDRQAALVLRLIENPSEFLATVQVGITLIGTFAAAFGGARLAEMLAHWLAAPPVALSPAIAESLALLLVVALITYGSLVFGELVPKQIALRNPEALARRVARPIALVDRLARPVVRLLTVSTNVVLTLLGLREERGGPSVTPDEIEAMVRAGAAEGIFAAREHELISEVLHFGERTVRQIMTPRPDIVAFRLDTPAEEVWATIHAHPYSRYPVYHETLDDASGFVHVKDLLRQITAGEPFNLAALVRPLLLVPEETQAASLLPRFQEEQTHMALIFDEYGTTIGLVTLEDVLEELVGAIEDEHQVAETPIVERDDESWLVDGGILLDDLEEFLEARLDTRVDWPEREELGYDTLAGFILALLGRIPTAGDTLIWGPLRFEVVDMDGHRVDKVLIQQEAPSGVP